MKELGYNRFLLCAFVSPWLSVAPTVQECDATGAS